MPDVQHPDALPERSHVTGPARNGGALSIDLRDDEVLDISVVMPCLNEERSIGVCIEKAWAGIRGSGLRGEVIVADNGSTDGSVAVAAASGATVVHEPRRGYGNAYISGFAKARGRIIVMGDSDDSYDFTAIPKLVAPLANGEYDYVLGSRFGGTIVPGAMTWSHRYIGNPVLTTVLNLLFDLEVSDAHSGMRAFTRTALDRMALRCEGMEFASEIVVKAARTGLRVAEVPIVYHPRVGESKLNSVRDGWRHLRFLLTLSPNHLLLLPGLLLLVGGFVAEAGLALAGGGSLILLVKVLVGLLAVLGGGLLTCGVFAGTYSSRFGFDRAGRLSSWVDGEFSLERGLVTGGALALVGVGLITRQFVVGWAAVESDPVSTSAAIMAMLLLTLGLQVGFGSFVFNILQVLRHALPASTTVTSMTTMTAVAAVTAVTSVTADALTAVATVTAEAVSAATAEAVTAVTAVSAEVGHAVALAAGGTWDTGAATGEAS